MSQPIEQLSGFPGFVPPRWLRDGHVQTIAGNFWPRAEFSLPGEPILVPVDEATGSRVLCHCHWQPEPADRLTLLLVHGLEGSSESRYIQGITELAWAAGCNVVRMNMRNCGETDHLSPTLYHSGLSNDVACVAQAVARSKGLTRIALVGYSMGGNLVLKLAGEMGEGTAPLAPQAILAAVGVSPAMDLSASADALHERANRMYEWRFLRGLLARYRRKCRLFQQIYDPARTKGVNTLRLFDDRITAPYSGFHDAEDYYQRAASARVAGAIRMPTLLLHSHDDPFVRMQAETRAAIVTNPKITFLEMQRGGHCAFLHRCNGNKTHFRWAEAMLVHWLTSNFGA